MRQLYFQRVRQQCVEGHAESFLDSAEESVFPGTHLRMFVFIFTSREKCFPSVFLLCESWKGKDLLTKKAQRSLVNRNGTEHDMWVVLYHSRHLLRRSQICFSTRILMPCNLSKCARTPLHDKKHYFQFPLLFSVCNNMRQACEWVTPQVSHLPIKSHLFWLGAYSTRLLEDSHFQHYILILVEPTRKSWLAVLDQGGFCSQM